MKYGRRFKSSTQIVKGIYQKLVTALGLLIRNCGLLLYTTPTEDEVGKETRESERGLALIGDGVSYIEVTGFTDVDLDENYNILCDFEYFESASQEGIYGFDSGGVDRFYLMGYVGNEIRLGIYDKIVTTSETFVDGQFIKSELEIRGLNYSLKINDAELLSGTFIKTLSSKELELLTIGETGSPGECNIFNFQIQNLDSNETLTLDLNGYQSTLTQDLIPLRSSDGSTIWAEQLVTPPVALVLSGLESLQDELGDTVSKANGKNLFDVNQVTPDFFISGTTFLPTPSGTGNAVSAIIKINPNTTYYSGVTNASQQNVAFIDENKEYLGKGDTRNSGQFTTDSDTYYIQFTCRGDDITLQLELGSTPTTYESWIGNYRTRLLQDPYQDGSAILAQINGKSYGYVGDPELVVYPQEIIGDGSTYIDIKSKTEDSEDFIWETICTFKDLSQQWNGARTITTNERFVWGINGGKWFLGYKSNGADSLVVADTNRHTFKVTGNGKLYIDNFLVIDKSASSGSLPLEDLFLLASNYSSLNQCNCDVESSKITYANGITYTLNTIPTEDTDEYQLIGDNGEIILCQQYVTPPVPTQDNPDAEDMHMVNGYSIQTPITTYEDDNVINEWDRVVDGVVASLFSKNGFVVDIENISGEDYYKLTNVSSVGLLSDDVALHADFKSLTQYTFSTDAYELNDANNLRLIIWYDDASKDNMFVPNLVEQNFVFTSDVGKTISKVTWDFSSLGGTTYIKKSTFVCYEGISIPVGQPSGVYESGNSKVGDIYFDKLGQNLVESNFKVPNLQDGVTSSGYLSNGNHFTGQYVSSDISYQPRADSVGSIMKNMRVVDGVVDNGVGYENWDDTKSGVEIVNGDSIRLTQGLDDTAILPTNLKENTVYTIVATIITPPLTPVGNLQLDGAGRDTAFIGDINFGVGSGEFRQLGTTKATITDNNVTFILSGVIATEEVTFKLSIYEGDYVTLSPPLPTSGVFESGNSIILDQPYDGITQYDLNRILTELDGTPKLITFDDSSAITNNQLFINKETKQIGFFSTPLTGDCLVKAEDFFNTLSHLLTEGGDSLLTENGDNLSAKH